jgi:NAD(P) transhydrogenase
MTELRQLVEEQVQSQQTSDQAELDRLGVDILEGDIRFLDPTSIQVGADKATADTIVLATGTRSATLGQAPLDGTRILAAEDLLSLPELPKSMIVVGAGQTGLDYAVLLAKLGVNVTVVDEHSNYFQLCGGLMGVTLFAAQSLDIAFRLGEEVIGIQQSGGGTSVAVRLSSGRVLTSDAALVCVGREGQTEGLDLESAGVGLDEHGRVWCDAQGRTWTPGITAIGDVVGFRATSLAG